MEVIQEFVDFIENLESSLVKLHGSGPVFRSIDLRILTKNIKNHYSIHDWIQNLNLPNHLKKNIILTILENNPPENVKNEFLAEMI